MRTGIFNVKTIYLHSCVHKVFVSWMENLEAEGVNKGEDWPSKSLRGRRGEEG